MIIVLVFYLRLMTISKESDIIDYIFYMEGGLELFCWFFFLNIGISCVF